MIPARFPAGIPQPASGDVCWRVLRSGLWVARRDGRHLGTVQRGRRWLAADADSEPIGVFRTFPEAQAAVTSPGPAAQRVRRAGSAVPALALAGLCTAGVLSTTAWVWTTLVS